MPKVLIRDWIDRVLLGGIYVIAMYYTYGWATEGPQFHAGTPCGGSIHKHWYWGGTPEHIVPVCLSDATVARENAVLDRMYGKR